MTKMFRVQKVRITGLSGFRPSAYLYLLPGEGEGREGGTGEGKGVIWAMQEFALTHF